MKTNGDASYRKDFADFFERHAALHIEKLEGRRSSYLKELKVYFVLAILAMIGAPFADSYVVSTLGYSRAEIAFKSLIYLFPITLAMFGILPVFRYRRDTKKTKIEGTRVVLDKKVYLKSLVFNNLLKFFGDFSFRRRDGLSLQDLQESMILPQYDEYFSEDCISGIYNGTKIKISESKLISHYHRRRVAVFSGLVIVLDISNPSIVLRSPFAGRTVVIQNDKKTLEYAEEKFKGFFKMDVPVSNLERRFKIFSTNKEEAERLVSKDFLANVIKLSEIIHYSKEGINHWDDRVMFWAAGAFRFFSSLFTSLFMTLSSLLMILVVLPWDLFNVMRGYKFRIRHKILLDWNIEPFSSTKHVNIYKRTASPDISELQTINEDIECSFNKNKVLITIPYERDIFEPNSIFKPALMKEDIQLLFEIMSLIFDISDNICGDKDNFVKD